MAFGIARPALAAGTLFFAGVIAQALPGAASVAVAQVQQSETLAPLNGSGAIGDPNEYLKEQLILYIRPRLPEERAYIDYVVLQVKTGILPVRLVNSSMLWARVKRPWPFPYFKRALIELAKKEDLKWVADPPIAALQSDNQGFGPGPLR